MAPDPTIAEALKAASAQLHKALPEEARLEAELLLAEVLKRDRSHLFAWPEKRLSADQQQHFNRLLEQRLSGKPLAYITGRREFWSLELQVTPETLIPRPETETLVERALDLIPPGTTLQIADLGTGSGAIAAAIASERPQAQITASDDSPAALVIARTNFQRLNLPHIEMAGGSWCDALPDGVYFDLIVSNPPYVAEDDPHLMLNGLPWEPRQALTAGINGLDDLREIIRQAPSHLQTGGHLLLEHGPDQGPAVRQLMTDQGFEGVVTHRDLEQRERVTAGTLPAGPEHP